MVRCTVTAFACIAAVSSLAPASSAEPARRPNVVCILADDLGWKDITPYGSTFHETPNLQRLADLAPTRPPISHTRPERPPLPARPARASHELPGLRRLTRCPMHGRSRPSARDPGQAKGADEPDLSLHGL